MKKIIIIFLLLIVLTSSLIVIAEKMELTDNLSSIIPLDEQKINIESYYYESKEGIKNVDTYKEYGEHVIISFKKTDWRVITSKDKFYDIMNNTYGGK